MMQTPQFLLLLVLALCWAEAQDIVCKSGKIKKTIKIGEGDSYSFKTQAGSTYAPKTKCFVKYKKKSSCPMIRFSCSEFNINNRKKWINSCKKNDIMKIQADGTKESYCQREGPDVTTSGNIKVSFVSDKKKQATGAVCRVECVADTTTTETTTTGPAIAEEEDTTTTTTTNEEEAPVYSGILIAGGLSTEVYIPETNKSCSFPSLPSTRWDSTLDTLQGVPVICGGRSGWHPSTSYTSCLQLDQVNPSGSWIDFATTTEGRYEATSWVKDDDPANPVLVLIGGRDRTSRTSAEIISFNESVLLTYTMPETRQACGIGFSDSTIVTGGYWTVSGSQVVRYNLVGNNPVDLNLVDTLPDLREGRYAHGCGSYTDGQDKTVLIVAGGRDSAYNGLDSTEKLVIGDPSWAIVQPLPRKLAFLSVFPNIGNKLYLTGGWDSMAAVRDEILVYDGETWEQVGRVKQPWSRASHAVTKINIDQGVCN